MRHNTSRRQWEQSPPVYLACLNGGRNSELGSYLM